MSGSAYSRSNNTFIQLCEGVFLLADDPDVIKVKCLPLVFDLSILSPNGLYLCLRVH